MTTTPDTTIQHAVKPTLRNPPARATTPSRPCADLLMTSEYARYSIRSTAWNAGLHGLGEQRQHRGTGREIEHEGSLVAIAREVGPDHDHSQEHGRHEQAHHGGRRHKLSGVRAVDDDGADEIVLRPEAERDRQQPGDGPRGDDQTDSGRAEQAGNDERPPERHRPGHELTAGKGEDIAREAAGLDLGRRRIPVLLPLFSPRRLHVLLE